MVLPSEKIKKEKLIEKHWAGSCNSMTCDTITFEAFKKYNSKLYQWGGYGEGFEFYKDNTAQEYSNVMCSDESSPVSSFPSKWLLKGDTLIVYGYYIKSTYQVLVLNKKILQLKILGFESKEIK